MIAYEKEYIVCVSMSAMILDAVHLFLQRAIFSDIFIVKAHETNMEMDKVSILYSCDQVYKDEIVYEENLSAENREVISKPEYIQYM